MTPLLDKPTRLLRAVLQKHHHVSEKLEVAGVVGLMRHLGSSLANVAEGRVSPFPESSEHGGVLMLQNPPLMDHTHRKAFQQA